MQRLAFISVLATLAVASTAHARPVSYAGGWTVMEETDRGASSAIVHYSPSAFYSVGLKADWDRRKDILFTGAQATWLAKRWFGEDHQANLYVWGAAGVAQGVGDGPGGDALAGQLGVMADWETRRWFLGYRAAARDYGALDASAFHAAKVGVAPYIGDTGDLHTWLMVEVDQRPDAPEAVDVTPMIRFFKGEALLEAGWSLGDDQPLLNFQYRF